MLNGPLASREKTYIRRALRGLAREGAVLDLGTAEGGRSRWRINPLNRGRNGATAL